MFPLNLCRAFCAWLTVWVESVCEWLPAFLYISVCVCVSVCVFDWKHSIYTEAQKASRLIRDTHQTFALSSISILSTWTESITHALGERSIALQLILKYGHVCMNTSNHYWQLKFNLTIPLTRAIDPFLNGMLSETLFCVFNLSLYHCLSNQLAFTSRHMADRFSLGAAGSAASLNY